MGLALEPTKVNLLSLENKHTKRRPRGCFLVFHNALKIVAAVFANFSGHNSDASSIFSDLGFERAIGHFYFFSSYRFITLSRLGFAFAVFNNGYD